MSCLLGLYLFGICVACGLFVQTVRVKLKTRYTLTLVSFIILILFYSKFSVCGNPVFQSVNSDPNPTNTYQKVLLNNSQELFGVLQRIRRTSELEYKLYDPRVLPKLSDTISVHDADDYKEYEKSFVNDDGKLVQESYDAENDVEIEVGGTGNSY